MMWLWTALFLPMGCGTPEVTEATTLAPPEAIGFAECGVCGMVVGEQPTPRGQVVHRDGTHVHFCSLGDLRAYIQAPGPRGRPTGTWVEGLEAGFDPSQRDTQQRGWLKAEEAHFVVGFERGGIMGRPTLSFASDAEAAAAAKAVGGHTTSWSQLASVPFSKDP